jgi:hypothetical protein
LLAHVFLSLQQQTLTGPRALVFHAGARECSMRRALMGRREHGVGGERFLTRRNPLCFHAALSAGPPLGGGEEFLPLVAWELRGGAIPRPCKESGRGQA